MKEKKILPKPEKVTTKEAGTSEIYDRLTKRIVLLLLQDITINRRKRLKRRK